SITLMGPGKAFNLAGILGFGIAIIPDAALRARFERHIFGISGHPTGIAYHATLAAYRDCDEWLVSLIEYLRSNRNYLQAEIDRIPGITMSAVEATFLGWLDVSALNLDAPHQHFLNGGVALSDGTDMGMSGHLRLNFGCARSTLEEMVSRIARSAAS
ncbi:MAG: aminotransferase class I/II-fold pyridoxal phosphate-dependent enzyme, partial [Halioglobus sp.]